MKVAGKPTKTLAFSAEDPGAVELIDQRSLPHELVVRKVRSVDEMAVAIRDMWVRGAPLIGVAAAFGMYLASLEAKEKGSSFLIAAAELLKSTRPTAVNLARAVEKQLAKLRGVSDPAKMTDVLLEGAKEINDFELESCRAIGLHGAALLNALADKNKVRPVNIMTHCNAGWLACVDYGTATAPIYEAFARGIDVHVWVSETRPRNQGAALTAWELGQHGVPHTLIVDNAAGHLLSSGKVDLVITGADRIARNGDTANKIGTYLKALAARDNSVPFYIAAPSSTIDPSVRAGQDIPIEERSQDEVRFIYGSGDNAVRICPENTQAANYGFDITPGRLLSGLITERGICAPTESGMQGLFPEIFEYQETGIKYRCLFTEAKAAIFEELEDINRVRALLRDRGLIGVNDAGVSFGNISVRCGESFIITGTGTGAPETLGPEHFARVTDYNLSENEVRASGVTRPSSEALTHAAVYSAHAAVQAVIHVHSEDLWQSFSDQAPATSSAAQYGSREIALEVQQIVKRSSRPRGIVVMGGHRPGIIAYANSVREAFDLLKS